MEIQSYFNRQKRAMLAAILGLGLAPVLMLALM